MKLSHKILLIISLTFITLFTYAVENDQRRAGFHYFFSDDTDSSKINKYTFDAFLNQYGASYSYIEYSGDNYSYYGDRIGFIKTGDNHEWDIGVLNFNSESIIDGYFRYFGQANPYVFYEFGAEIAPIDSQSGLDNSLISRTIYASGDFYNPNWDAGIALVPAYTLFEDNGNRNQIRSKLYKGIGQGFHLYVRNRYYVVSKPNNGFFFSPEEYSQILYGIGFRRYILKGFLKGHIDRGFQSVDGEREDSLTYRLEYTFDNSDMDFDIYYESDVLSEFYTYDHGGFSVHFRF